MLTSTRRTTVRTPRTDRYYEPSRTQDEPVDTHRSVQDAGLPCVLVGGWAVSAFQTRFTTDIDTVIPGTTLDDYDALLDDLGYEKQFACLQERNQDLDWAGD